MIDSPAAQVAQDAQDAHALFVGALKDAVRPRQRLSVTQWADAKRVLSSKGSAKPGRWKTSRAPFLQEPMDCLSTHSSVSKVVLMFPSQIGKTEVGLNWMGYKMDQSPSPMLVVVPTLDVRRRYVKQRLDPMIKETPCLNQLINVDRTRATGSSEGEKDYPGGMLIIGGANSAASLASMPIQDVICDEVDRFPWDVQGEGDPMGLISERQKNFSRRKTLLISTPTIEGASRIADEYRDSDQRQYHVPCPECDTGQPLRWKNLQWNNALTDVWYTCNECGSVIYEHQKPRMLAAGQWIPQNPGHPIRGYHINGLYSSIGLGYSWLELAQEWQRVQRDETKLKRFINTTLAETWQQKGSDLDDNALKSRAGVWQARTVPAEALLLTAGVDTQGGWLAIHIVGHGRNNTTFIVDYTELHGDLARPEIWMNLSEILNTPLTNAYGHAMRIQATAIDTGGHHTHEVYQYVRSKASRRLMAIKGKNTPGGSVLSPRPSWQDVTAKGKKIKRGVALWTVGTDTTKSMLYSRLANDEDKPEAERLIQFNADLGDDYYKMYTSEHFDEGKNKWVQNGKMRREAPDTWRYAVAAAHHPELRIQTFRDADWKKLETLLGPDNSESQAKKEPKEVPELAVPSSSQRPSKRRPRGRSSGFATNY